MTAPAVLAVTATQCEGDNHPVSHAVSAHVVADVTDQPDELVSEDVRQGAAGKSWPLALPAVPVASTDAAGFHLDDHTVRIMSWLRNILMANGSW